MAKNWNQWKAVLFHLWLVICNSVPPEQMSAQQILKNSNILKMFQRMTLVINTTCQLECCFVRHLNRVLCSAEVQRLEEGEFIGAPSSWIRCSIAWKLYEREFIKSQTSQTNLGNPTVDFQRCLSVELAESGWRHNTRWCSLYDAGNKSGHLDDGTSAHLGTVPRMT